MNAVKAADEIIRDLTSRRGLRQEWEEIDEDIQQEIKQTWVALIQKAIDTGGVCPAPGLNSMEVKA